jgi:hypothetical protein
MLVQFNTFMAFSSLNTLMKSAYLPAATLEEVRSSLALAGKSLQDLGRRAFLGKAIYQPLRGQLRDTDAHVLRDTESVEEDHVGAALDHAQQVESHYPINNPSIAEDPESSRVSNLIAAYKELCLREGSQ